MKATSAALPWTRLALPLLPFHEVLKSTLGRPLPENQAASIVHRSKAVSGV
jgi:hypothetical protein